MLLVPALADSLAGRIGILRVHPLSQSELAGRSASCWKRSCFRSYADRQAGTRKRSASTTSATRTRAEVDVVLECGPGRVAGVEVKAAATVTAADFRGLRKLREAAGERFAAGVVLYDGETTSSFGNGLHAVPIRTLWEVT